MFPAEEAKYLLAELYLDFLHNTRLNLYDMIEVNRDEVYFENEVVRPALRREIKTMGDAITMARMTNASDFVINTLIEQIRAFNNCRHTNRERVKELAYEQSVNKALLAEVNREISYLETEQEYAEALR